MLMRQLAGVGAGGSARQSDAAAAGIDRSGAGTASGVPGATTDPNSIAESKQDFIRSLWPHAQQAGRELGVDPHALLAQAALETGWGKSVPCTAAGDCSFNLFGIKAGGQWSGATVNVPTLEFEQGVAVRKVERFRAYESPAASFNDYARLIRNNPRYENALGAGADVASFASALQNGGYATDPQYARKLTAVANELRQLTGSTGQASVLNFTGARPIAVDAGV
jgi:flagellar protein FlgJ